jgi:glucokinase
MSTRFGIVMIEGNLLAQSCIPNNTNVAVVGEMLYGAAHGVDNFICLTLGTGLGCGLVVNGELVMGLLGHAGELWTERMS